MTLEINVVYGRSRLLNLFLLLRCYRRNARQSEGIQLCFRRGSNASCRTSWNFVELVNANFVRTGCVEMTDSCVQNGDGTDVALSG